MELKPIPSARFRVTANGSITVESVLTHYRGRRSAMISVNLKEKWADLCATGHNENIPCITLSTPSTPEEDSAPLTEVEFPGYKGWSIWSAHASKYTTYVALLKPENEE